MSYLITADIHGNRKWYKSLKENSGRHTATLIAGDILDWHDESSTERSKVDTFLRYAQSMEDSGASLVFTSGNHDLDDLILLPALRDGDVGPAIPIRDNQWMRFPAENGMQHVSSYGSWREFEDLVVASIRWQPWGSDCEVSEGEVERLCTSAYLAASAADKKLAFIYHEKPENNHIIQQMVRECRPQYFMCGHDHEDAFIHGPARMFEDTIVINSGQNLAGALPACSVLNVADNTLDWYTHLNDFKAKRLDLSQIPSPDHEITQSNPEFQF